VKKKKRGQMHSPAPAVVWFAPRFSDVQEPHVGY